MNIYYKPSAIHVQYRLDLKRAALNKNIKIVPPNTLTYPGMGIPGHSMQGVIHLQGNKLGDGSISNFCLTLGSIGLKIAIGEKMESIPS